VFDVCCRIVCRFRRVQCMSRGHCFIGASRTVDRGLCSVRLWFLCCCWVFYVRTVPFRNLLLRPRRHVRSRLSPLQCWDVVS